MYESPASSSCPNPNHDPQHKQIENLVQIFNAIQSLTAVNPNQNNLEFLTTFLNGMFSTEDESNQQSVDCELFMKIGKLYEAYKTLERFFPERAAQVLMSTLKVVLGEKCSGEKKNPDDGSKQMSQNEQVGAIAIYKTEMIKESNQSIEQALDFDMVNQQQENDEQDNPNQMIIRKPKSNSSNESVTILEPENNTPVDKISNRSKLSSPQVNPSSVNDNSTKKKLKRLDEKQNLLKTPKNSTSHSFKMQPNSEQMYRCKFCPKTFHFFAGKEHHEKKCRPSSSRTLFRRSIPSSTSTRQNLSSVPLPSTWTSALVSPMIPANSSSTGPLNTVSNDIQKVKNWLLTQNHEDQNEDYGKTEILDVDDNNERTTTIPTPITGEASVSLSNPILKPLPKLHPIPSSSQPVTTNNNVKSPTEPKFSKTTVPSTSKLNLLKNGKVTRTRKESSSTVKSNESHICDFCQKKFQHKQNLAIHVRIHTGEKPYSCRYCSQKFATPGNCRTHENTKKHDQDRLNLIIENKRKSIASVGGEKQGETSQTNAQTSFSSSTSSLSSSAALSPLIPTEGTENNDDENLETEKINEETGENSTEPSTNEKANKKSSSKKEGKRSVSAVFSDNSSTLELEMVSGNVNANESGKKANSNCFGEDASSQNSEVLKSLHCKMGVCKYVATSAADMKIHLTNKHCLPFLSSKN